MKKLILLFCCLFLVLLSACSKTSSDNELKFMTWGSESEIKVVKFLVDEYEKQNHNVKIKLIHVPQNYFQKLHLLLSSGIEPDVMFVNNIYSQMYISANLFEDLTSYFADDLKNEIFFDSAISSFSRDNRLYVIPRDISNLVLFVNKDIFQQKGIKLPDKFNSVQELTDILMKVTSESNYGINFETNSLFWLYFVSAQGGGIISDDLKNIVINSSESIDALQKYSDFANKYHIAPTKSEMGSKTSAQMFINGELAMLLNGRWFVPIFRQLAKFDWDVMEFPVDDSNKLLVDTSGFAISKRSKKKDIAVDFVKYMTSKNSVSVFAQDGLIIPARKDVAYSDIFLDESQKPKNNVAFLNTILKSKPTPINDNYLFINDIINQSLESMFLGKLTAKEALDNEAVKNLEKLL